MPLEREDPGQHDGRDGQADRVEDGLDDPERLLEPALVEPVRVLQLASQRLKHSSTALHGALARAGLPQGWHARASVDMDAS